MKNKAGMVCGFVIGTTGFLLLFKFFFLDKIRREDELTPGIVVFASVLSGLTFALIGYFIQNHFTKKNDK